MTQPKPTPPPAGSGRTIYPKEHRRPLTGRHFDEAKAAESARKKYDPSYITADDARALPSDIAQRPDMQERIRYSQPDWPESRSTATRALGPLPTGEGQEVDERVVESADLFQGGSMKENG